MIRFRRPNGSWVFPAVNGGVVLCASVITASLALVVEDFFPRDAQDGRIVLARWLLLIAALAGLVITLSLRNVVHRRRGTLFYVHLLDEVMPNLRAKSVSIAGARRLSARSVTRWADLATHTRNGVIDLTDQCHEIGTTVEEAINADRDDTGYVLAPNMLWPTALAVGAYLPHADSLRLLELPPRDGDEELEFDLNPTKPISVVRRTHSLAPDSDEPGRVGVWLAFGPAAKFFTADRFTEFGVTSAHILSADGKIPPEKLTARQLEALGRELAETLVGIKHDAGDRELVIVAMIPKAVGLALGWHLAQAQCRFFHGTHLMHHDRDSDSYIPMRVRASQPTWPPQPLHQQRVDIGAETELRNLTPHQLDLVTDDGSVSLPPAQQPPRITETTSDHATITVDDTTVPVVAAEQGEVIGLPEATPGVLLVVSRPVAARYPHRADLVVPFREIRDDTGRITGCRALARLTHPEPQPAVSGNGHHTGRAVPGDTHA